EREASSDDESESEGTESEEYSESDE
ncbi:hypothetical protein KIPB_011614, partial [Kipferlia bialata]